MKKAAKYLLCSLLILFSANHIHAQEEDVDFQTWIDFNFVYQFNSKWSIRGDGGFRGVLSQDDWNLFYIRPKARYIFSQFFDVEAGIGSFNTFEENLSNSYEFRIQQDLNVRWPDLGFVDFTNRFRLEQRFFTYEDSELADDFSVRFRYRLRMESMYFSLFKSSRKFFVGAQSEFFFPASNSPLERYVNDARVSIFFSQRIGDTWRYELDYTWQQSKEFSDDGFQTTENVLRVRLFYTISKKTE